MGALPGPPVIHPRFPLPVRAMVVRQHINMPRETPETPETPETVDTGRGSATALEAVRAWF